MSPSSSGLRLMQFTDMIRRVTPLYFRYVTYSRQGNSTSFISNLNFTHCTAVRPINVPVINSPANRSPRPTDAGHQHLVSSWLNMTLLNSVIPGRRPDYTDTVTLHAHIQPFSQIFMKSLSQRVVSKVKLMAQNNLI